MSETSGSHNRRPYTRKWIENMSSLLLGEKCPNKGSGKPLLVFEPPEPWFMLISLIGHQFPVETDIYEHPITESTKQVVPLLGLFPIRGQDDS